MCALTHTYTCSYVLHSQCIAFSLSQCLIAQIYKYISMYVCSLIYAYICSSTHSLILRIENFAHMATSVFGISLQFGCIKSAWSTTVLRRSEPVGSRNNFLNIVFYIEKHICKSMFFISCILLKKNSNIHIIN